MTVSQAELDPRIHAFDPATRLAEAALRGVVEGEDWQFVTPRPACAGQARLSLRARPDGGASQVADRRGDRPRSRP